MTDFDGPTQGSQLNFHGPLSEARADRLVRSFAAHSPSTIVDFGCGWGEMLLRMVSATGNATGIGIDTFAPDVARARAAAAARGLGDRVQFLEQSGTDYSQPADLVLCLGASQVFGPIPEALKRLRELVKPGGRLLFADGFWERTPTQAELANMWPDASMDDQTDLATLLEQAEAAGFRATWVETANRDEWEFFESGIIADQAEWLLANPDSPKADEVRETVDRFRYRLLRGYRDILGYAFLSLAVPAETS